MNSSDKWYDFSYKVLFRYINILKFLATLDFKMKLYDYRCSPHYTILDFSFVIKPDLKGPVSLFNSISTFIGYLMPNSITIAFLQGWLSL